MISFIVSTTLAVKRAEILRLILTRGVLARILNNLDIVRSPSSSFDEASGVSRSVSKRYSRSLLYSILR